MDYYHYPSACFVIFYLLFFTFHLSVFYLLTSILSSLISIFYPLSSGPLHIPSILASHLKQSMGNLTQGAVFCGFHQGFEHIVVFNSATL